MSWCSLRRASYFPHLCVSVESSHLCAWGLHGCMGIHGCMVAWGGLLYVMQKKTEVGFDPLVYTYPVAPLLDTSFTPTTLAIAEVTWEVSVKGALLVVYEVQKLDTKKVLKVPTQKYPDPKYILRSISTWIHSKTSGKVWSPWRKPYSLLISSKKVLKVPTQKYPDPKYILRSISTWIHSETSRKCDSFGATQLLCWSASKRCWNCPHKNTQIQNTS